MEIKGKQLTERQAQIWIRLEICRAQNGMYIVPPWLYKEAKELLDFLEADMLDTV
tara:strand:- start:2857 stop:3021 length:165 start_codon:yes stop_codon:yes gene_type:complete